MTEVEDVTCRVAEPPVCPQCGKADDVQKISAIPHWPAEYGPPRAPSSVDLAGAVVLALGTVCIAVVPFTTGWMGMMGIYLVIWGAQRLLTKRGHKAQWGKTMSRWERLYFCARDEVAFIRGGTFAIPLDEIRDSLLADVGRESHGSDQVSV